MIYLEIWASVDIMNGKVVRLIKGNPNNIIVYGDDPVSMVMRWESLGFDGVHVVDLNAALGMGDNLEKVRMIPKVVKIPVQIGGGIRSIQYLRMLMEIGFNRFVIGTVAFREPNLLNEMVNLVGSDKLMVALDHRSGKVVIKGWVEELDIDIVDAALKLTSIGIKNFLVTDVERDGTLSGHSLEAISRVVKLKGTNVYAAGGISKLSDIAKLKEVGVRGIILGRAIYEGEIDIPKAISLARSG